MSAEPATVHVDPLRRRPRRCCPCPTASPTGGSRRTTRSPCAWNRSTRRSRPSARASSRCSTGPASARSRSRSAATPPRGTGRSPRPSATSARSAGRCTGAAPGDLLGVRGPFGIGWDLDTAVGRDLVIVAGGVGLAPLRPVLLDALRAQAPLRPGRAGRGRAEPGGVPLRRPARRLARHRGPGGRAHRRPPEPRLVGPGRVRHRAARPPGARPAADHGVPVRSGADDAVLGRRAARPPACRRATSASRWSGTCSAASGCAGTASSGRCSSAGTGPSSTTPAPTPCSPSGSCDMPPPTLAVWKFASCDGCQLTLLDCEDELTAWRAGADHALPRGVQHRPAGTVRRVAGGGLDHDTGRRGAHPAGPRAVEGAGHHRRVRHLRRRPGPAQRPDVEEFQSVVYASPHYIDTLATSTPIAAHVPVDLELRGCPIDKGQLLEMISALLAGRQAGRPRHQRLHRVQAARADLRDGRERHPVPGPGHARRLRRALPRGRPRLLRLLRARGRREPPRAGRPAAHVRDEPADGRPGLLHVQRRPRSARPPTGEAAMTAERPATCGSAP